MSPPRVTVSPWWHCHSPGSVTVTPGTPDWCWDPPRWVPRHSWGQDRRGHCWDIPVPPQVPHYEFLELKLERQRVAYLKDKVAKALASDTAGDTATDTAT